MSKSKSGGDKRRARKKPRASMASKADRHALYQEAVQCVEAEIDFVDETFKTLRGRRARTLREDFCGTANTACEWVRRRATNRAVGVDLDAEVQAWGMAQNVSRLGKAAARVRLVHGDVLQVREDPVDIVLAMNFSYWLFTTRKLLLRYFRKAHKALARDGVFFLDAYGGYEAFHEMRERTDNDGFTYIWDQAEYSPVTGAYVCHIHFKFPDGSRIKNAFTYEWRLWTLPEIRELLVEAGFHDVTVYWQGSDEETGEGNGEFEPTERGEADAAWIVYLSASK